MENFQPDLIIGSSMGGYVADILAEKYGTPAILFNPALHNRSFDLLLSIQLRVSKLTFKRKNSCVR